jgi:hypothetical protein
MMDDYHWFIVDCGVNRYSPQIQPLQMEVNHYTMSSDDLTAHDCQDTADAMETTSSLIRYWWSKMIRTVSIDGL